MENELIVDTSLKSETDQTDREFTVEEFSITELEERLELVGRCNPGCKGQ